MKQIDWSKQHCGVISARVEDVIKNMPDLEELIMSFPENPSDFLWDVKVHMLMPDQFPCIPNWHYDNIPRVEGVQYFSLVQLDKPMYLWLSGEPLTEFRKDGVISKVKPREWVRFNQDDEHKGVSSDRFTWRGFIRATHKDINNNFREGKDVLRRHCQVYLDSEKFVC